MAAEVSLRRQGTPLRLRRLKSASSAPASCATTPNARCGTGWTPDWKQSARHSRKAGHQNTCEQFAREWHESQRARWKPIHAEDVIESMAKDLFPEIGGYPVDQIDEGLLLHALRKVEARGAIETARRLRQRAERVFRFAAGASVPNATPP